MTRKKKEEALGKSSPIYRNIFENIGAAILIIEQDATISLVNSEFEKLIGFSREEVEGNRSWVEFLAQDEYERTKADFSFTSVSSQNVPISRETRFVDRQRNVRDIHLTITKIPGTQRMVASLFDITERKRAEDTIKEMAYRDPLTGLPNRMLFNDRLSLALARAHRNRAKLAVILLDLDRFKDINDTLGHTAGDQLLHKVGDRLASLVRKSDTVARMGGDEFILLLSEIARIQDASKIAEKILHAFDDPFSVTDREIHVTPSIGIAIYPVNGEDADSLMRNADIAMYRAKELGRNNYQCYAPAMNQIRLPFMYMTKPNR